MKDLEPLKRRHASGDRGQSLSELIIRSRVAIALCKATLNMRLGVTKVA